MVEQLIPGLDILLAILAVIWLIIWVLTLVHQAKRGRYWWIAFTALIQAILILYWLVYVSSKKFRKTPK